MHEIKREQSRAQEGILRFFEQALAERIQHRQHGNADERAHDPPAERIHAEYGDANGNDQLAERRMRILVGREVVQVFIGGARMIQFVEIHAVEVGRPVRHGILLIEQRRLRSGRMQNHRIDAVSLRVEKCNFVQLQRPGVELQLDPARGERRLHPVPAEHHIIGLGIGFLMSVIGPKQQDAVVLDVAVNPVLTDRRLGREFHRDRFSGRFRLPIGFRRRKRAQIGQSNDAVNQHQSQQEPAIFPRIHQAIVGRQRRQDGRAVSPARPLGFMWSKHRRPGGDRFMDAVTDQNIDRNPEQVQKADQFQCRAGARNGIVNRPAKPLMIDDVHGRERVDEQRDRHAAEADQDAAVALIEVSHEQQQQYREQVPLMHIVAKSEDHAQHAGRRKIQRALVHRSGHALLPAAGQGVLP